MDINNEEHFEVDNEDGPHGVPDNFEDSAIPVELIVDEAVAAVEAAAAIEQADSAESQNSLSRKYHISGASEDPITDYLNQIAETPLLTAELEVELAMRIEAGLFANEKLLQEFGTVDNRRFTVDALSERDKRVYSDLQWIMKDGESARQHLIKANLRLVAHIAKRYVKRGMPYLDLIQEGNLGLIRAVEKFDYTQGYKFSTYATWWIRQAIQRGLANQSHTIRIPAHVVEKIDLVNRAKSALLETLGREPSLEEISQFTEIPELKIVEYLRHDLAPISLSTPVPQLQSIPDELVDGDAYEFGDLVVDGNQMPLPDQALVSARNQKLENLLAGLSAREAAVIKLRYGLVDGVMRTLDQIGEELGITRERARQLEAKTMAKLQHPDRAQLLYEFFSPDQMS